MTADFYEGAYGPTLRFASSSEQDLEMLLDVFSQLSSGACHQLELIPSKVAASYGITRISLGVVIREPSRSVRQLHPFPRLAIQWSRSRAGWDECVGRIEGLIESGGPGHQYLSTERVDDALIEISYRE
jgi:hypothetical protein